MAAKGTDGGVFGGYSPATATSGFGQIQGALPWNAGGSGAGAFGGGAIGQAYQSAYNSALGMNQSNYNNILTGYQQAIAAQTSAQQAIQSGYTDLYNNVLGNIDASYAGQSTQLNNQAAQNLASSSQQLINRGLGNTTIQTSVNQGINNQLAQQQQLLTGQQAGQKAQYQSQLGLAGLANQEQGLQNTTGLALSQLGFMNSADFQYPNGGMYGQLAQIQAQNQALQHNPYPGAGGSQVGLPKGGGGGGGQLGYVPGQPYYGGSGQGSIGGGSFGGGLGQWATGVPPAAAANGNVFGNYGGNWSDGSGASVPDFGDIVSGYNFAGAAGSIAQGAAYGDNGAVYPDYGGGGDYGSYADYGGGGDY